MSIIVAVAVVVVAALIWMWQANRSTDSKGTSGFPDPSPEFDLLRMVHKDEAKAERLIQAEIARNPRLTRRKAAKRARDRLHYVRWR